MCLYSWLRSKEQNGHNGDCEANSSTQACRRSLRGDAALLTEADHTGTKPFPQELWGSVIEDYHVFQLNFKTKAVG